MKLLKGILFFFLIIIGAALVAALFAPGTKLVERSITVESPQKVVFNQIANFKNWPKWDAWYSKDTNQVRTYSGTMGEENYSYSWSSKNSDVGKGRMVATKVTGIERLDFTFYFDNDGTEESADGYFVIKENGDKTDVTWAMVSEMSYPFKAFNYFIDGMVGPDFEEGLSNLKELVESTDLSSTGQNVQIVEEFGINYALIKRENLPMQEMDTFFSSAYKEIYSYMQTNGLSPKGEARGLYYEWDEENGKTTLAAAVPVSSIEEEDGSSIDLGVGKSMLLDDRVICTLTGGYSASYGAHIALSKWLEENGKELRNPVVEEYLVGPKQTQDTAQYVTKISYHF
ncbi:MAG: hypothetical protein COA58_16560 [Bacteroidetes bacterium]|nr:MAG: hypothetical protein COA58_16560 [Bacteroidota bacterium]